MKKPLALLFAWVSVAPVCAQGNVTIYGLLDVSAGQSRSGSGTTLPSGSISAGPSQVLLREDAGVVSGSRLGFKGVEDLSGWLKARFQIEMGIAADTGGLTQGGLAFGRMSFVGLGGKDWSLTAGRHLTPMHVALGNSEALSGGYWGNAASQAEGMYESVGATAGGGAFQLASRADNSVLLSAFRDNWTVSAIVGAGNEDPRGAGRYADLTVSYGETGPFKANASFAKIRQNAEQIVASASPQWQTSWMLGGSYDFRAAVLFAGVYQFTGPANKATLAPVAVVGARGASAFAFAWDKNRLGWIGVKVPVATANLRLQVIREIYGYNGAEDGTSTTLAVAYEYFLSKVTSLYLSYAQVKNNERSNTALFGAIPVVGSNGFGGDPRALSVGMRHSF